MRDAVGLLAPAGWRVLRRFYVISGPRGAWGTGATEDEAISRRMARARATEAARKRTAREEARDIVCAIETGETHKPQGYDEKLARKKAARNEINRRYRKNNPIKVRISSRARMGKWRGIRKELLLNAPFVAIDSEGMNVGSAFGIETDGPNFDLGLPDEAASQKLAAQDHRTFLWGAGDSTGNLDWLGTDKRSLGSREILEWVCSLRAKFPGAIFVMFAASYDWTQICRDMDFDTAWELWKGLPASERKTPTGEKANRQRWVLWRDFALRFHPHKFLEIAKFRDPNKIKKENAKFDFLTRIKIFDVFGFFQSTFIKASTGFGGDFLTAEDRKIIEDGKTRRTDFRNAPLEEIKAYTACELRTLSRMMTKMREGLHALELKPKDWHGAGVIAKEMMTRGRIPEYYPELSANIPLHDMNEPQSLALRAYFGGRVEMIKQGVRKAKFWNYDISSAYPHIERLLPNMKNGAWRAWSYDELMTPSVDEFTLNSEGGIIEEDGRFRSKLAMTPYARSNENLDQMLELIEEFSLVSMIRVRFSFPSFLSRVQLNQDQLRLKERATKELRWFPLPVRAEDGTIYFPELGSGVYMVEEVRAMLRWAKRIYAGAKDRPKIALLGAKQFLPVNEAKPFADLVEKGFAERKRIVEETESARKQWEAAGKQGPEPYDVREKILKLGLNSTYGKTAQSAGPRIVREDGVAHVKPPKLTNIFYAAAVTAGTRAMLLDAASSAPDDIILFATDGICATRELTGLTTSERKELGKWEVKERKNGVFVKAGIYYHEPFTGGKPETKMRGIRPQNLPNNMTAAQWLITEAPTAWANDLPALHFEYHAYKTIGAALASEKTWRLAGHWIAGQRKTSIQTVSKKRSSAGLARTQLKDGTAISGQTKRSRHLFDTDAAPNPLEFRLSRPYSPDWLDENAGDQAHAGKEQIEITFNSGFGYDVD